MRIALIEAHFGEEPPISGNHGSGTVFFSGCPMRCVFCQNYQISQDRLGRPWAVQEVVDRLARLHALQGIHNVNFVTADHFVPHAMSIVRGLRERGVQIPILFNLSGYQDVETLRLLEPFADIYLPDFKYSDISLAKNLSNSPDYPGLALDALAEMVRQKGFLDAYSSNHRNEEPQGEDPDGFALARRGVLVRHLILPGQVRNALDALTMLHLEFGRDLPLSLMSQYVPVRPFPNAPGLNRPVTQEEFQEVLDHALSLGYRKLLVQHPEPSATRCRPFLPDFRRPRPFDGNTGRAASAHEHVDP
jgi:putative pyruvate formate lyase activating enzyme